MAKGNDVPKKRRAKKSAKRSAERNKSKKPEKLAKPRSNKRQRNKSQKSTSPKGKGKPSSPKEQSKKKRKASSGKDKFIPTTTAKTNNLRSVINVSAGLTGLSSLTLASYNNNPAQHSIANSDAINFNDDVLLVGNAATDVLTITFQQPNSPNWEIASPLVRSFAVNNAGLVSFPDGLVFRLKSGRVRVAGETFAVNSSAHLESNPAVNQLSSLVVTA